jgi:molybdopterin converting factor small subunit
MPTIDVPPPYRGPTRGVATVEVEGKTVGECLHAVEAQYPGFDAQIFDPQGRVHGFVRLFINGEPVERDALDTEVSDSDTVEVLAAIAGG